MRTERHITTICHNYEKQKGDKPSYELGYQHHQVQEKHTAHYYSRQE